MKTKNIILFISLALLPILASAQSSEIEYFEFAPDESNNFSVSRRGEIIQPFIISNDLISGFDLWLDNSVSGSISVSLLNNTNQTLVSKSVSVPILSPAWGGRRFHIALSQTVAVTGDQIYKIKISGASNGINIYYANRVAPLEHNAVYSPLEKIVMPAVVSGIEQNFSVKFALFDNSDLLPPALSNLISSISSGAASIKFNANEPVDFKITIESSDNTQSQTEPFKNSYQICNQLVTTCGSIFTISPNTQYDYQILARDQWGNESGINGTIGVNTFIVSTSTPTDTTPPVISNIRVLSLSQNSALFAWTTNEPANSSVLIGLVKPYQIVTSIGDSTYEIEHAINSGSILQPNTNYFASIMSTDIFGNSSNQYIEFTTLPAPPPTDQPPPTEPPQPLPIISPTSTPPIAQITTTTDQSQNLPSSLTIFQSDQTLNINWSAPASEPSGGYLINIFDANYNLVKKISVSKGTLAAALNDLPAGEYKAIIYSDNNGIFEKISKPVDFSASPKTSPFSLKNSLYGSLTVLLLIAAGIVIYFIKKKKVLPKNESAFTLIELLVAMGIGTIITLFIGYFIRNVINFETIFGGEIKVQQELLQIQQTVIPEIRSMRISAVGGYPIAEASSSSFTFFSDVDGDSVMEQVRYFTSSTILEKSVIEPSGNPPVYNPANQIITDMIHNLNMGTSSIFSYYDANYSGSEPEMAYPINISLIREVGVKIIARDENANSLQEISIKVAPRNLRTNL